MLDNNKAFFKKKNFLYLGRECLKKLAIRN